MSCLSIDPGLDGTGVVYWYDGVPLAATVIYPPKTGTLYSRATSILTKLSEFEYDVARPADRSYVVIEFPEFQEGLRGSTARRTGSIDKLAFLVGMIARHYLGGRVRLPRVRDWKGQLPKDVVTRRMIKHYGAPLCAKLNIRTHAWDALGIGHWFITQKG